MTSMFKMFSSMAAVMTVALMVHANGPVRMADEQSTEAPVVPASQDQSQNTNICGITFCTNDFQCTTACGEPASCVLPPGTHPLPPPNQQRKQCMID
jgi:hypothetical protein